MRLRLIIGCALALLAVLALVIVAPEVLRAPTPPSQKTVSDFPADFSFEIVSTPEAREQGLSGRADIPSNYGMLFVFEIPGRYGFWMHEMLTAIDIIWLNEDGSIVGIESNVSPDTFPQTFVPPVPVRYVLETRAGESARLGLEIGETIPLPVR
jgi:uncharacterized membrane protein (UPF0127 family)